LVISISSAPNSTIVPAKASLPTTFSCGTLSPVMGAWLTEPAPSVTFPSTGIFSPALAK